MTLNEHPHSVPVAICRATALVVLRALPCGVITCRGRVEPIEVYLVVEETGASVLPANLATMYAQRHVEEYLAEIGDVAPDASFDMVRDRWPTGPLCPLCNSVLTAAG